MTTLRDTLQSINAYPIPTHTITSVGTGRELDLEAPATREAMLTPEYRLATADILYWLASAPNISQGGQSYSFSEEQRERFRDEADEILDELENERPKPKYGYKGSMF